MVYHRDRYTEPLKRRDPKVIFTCSMGDLYHERADWEELAIIHGVMVAASKHVYLALTKRPQVARAFLETYTPYECWLLAFQELGPSVGVACISKDASWRDIPWLWLGTSAEDQQNLDKRMPELIAAPVARRFVSAEPLLGPLDLKEFTSYCPCYEHNQACRGTDLQSGDIGRVGDRQRWSSVESRSSRLGSLEASCSNTSVSSPQSGEGSPAWLSDGAVYGGRSEDIGDGAQIGLETFLRSDSAGASDQSQERNKRRQSPVQSGNSDTERERSARIASADGWEMRESVRSAESRGKAESGAGAGYSAETSGGRKVEADFRTLQCGCPDDFAHRSRRAQSLWLICGGESGGPAERSLLAPQYKEEWVRSIRDQCAAAGVPFMFKQWGGKTPKSGGRFLDGRTHDDNPARDQLTTYKNTKTLLDFDESSRAPAIPSAASLWDSGEPTTAV